VVKTEQRGEAGEAERLGRYELLTRVAAGGMAEVFVARVRGEGGFERLVAIKRMLPTIAEEDHFAEMFLDEGRIAGLIESPHVVQIYDVGRADSGELFIAMELVRGVPLHRLLSLLGKQREIIPVPIAVAILVQAAEGLGAAHSASTPMGEPLGIVHRDVSPQNILLGIDGRVRVADFGVARAVHRRTSTSTGELKGKLAYFAPEQLRSLPATAQSDVFALGIVAWETLAMRRLFQGDNPVDTIERIRNLEPTPLHELRRDVHPDLSAAIARALSKDPSSRTPSALRFASDLREAFEPADPATLARYVRTWAEAEVRSLEDRIRAALTGQHDATSQDIALPLLPEERSGVRHADEATQITPSHPVVNPLVNTGPIRVAMAIQPPSPTPSLMPMEVVLPASAPLPDFSSMLPPAVSPAAPQRTSSRVLPIVLGLVVLFGLGAGAWAFSERASPVVEVHALPTYTPEPVTPVPAVATTAPAEAPVEAGVAAPPEVLEAPFAVVEESEGRPARRHGSGGASRGGPEATTGGRTEPTVAEVRTDPARAETPPETRATEARTETRPTETGSTETPRRRGGLLGVDSFLEEVEGE
jgi:serine/threonine protein kinase